MKNDHISALSTLSLCMNNFKPPVLREVLSSKHLHLLPQIPFSNANVDATYEQISRAVSLLWDVNVSVLTLIGLFAWRMSRASDTIHISFNWSSDWYFQRGFQCHFDLFSRLFSIRKYNIFDLILTINSIKDFVHSSLILLMTWMSWIYFGFFNFLKKKHSQRKRNQTFVCIYICGTGKLKLGHLRVLHPLNNSTFRAYVTQVKTRVCVQKILASASPTWWLHSVASVPKIPHQRRRGKIQISKDSSAGIACSPKNFGSASRLQLSSICASFPAKKKTHHKT